MDSLVFITSIVMNTKEYEFLFECQQQLYTFKLFDLTTITDTLQSSNFASGFAFDTQVIKNAFLDVQSISSNFTIFKTQSTFLNIKVQLNDISFGTGALLSPSSTVQIYQLSMISKTGTQVTIGAGSVFSILQQAATITNITNLILNINMNPSSVGNINLINVVRGQLIVKGYQILGSYNSTNTITLIACQIQQSNIIIEYVQFNPILFSCGNLSSYLISYSNSSYIEILHLVIQLGNLSTYNTMSNIITNISQFMLFGGLITISNTSNIKIQDITLNSYEQWNNQTTNNSGQILGQVNNSISNIYMICATEYVSSGVNTQFYRFGLIGYFNGQLTIQILSLQSIILPGSFTHTGMIGYVNGTKSTFMNVYISFQLAVNTGDYCGSLAGKLMAVQQQIYNISIIESQIEAHILVGLISSDIRNCSITNTKIVSSQVSGNSQNNVQYSAGLFASTQGYIQIIQCYIQNISISAQSSQMWAISGGLLGDAVDSSTLIQQTKLISSEISGTGSVSKSVSSGGLVGYQFDGKMNINNVYVQYTNITAISLGSPLEGTFCGTFAAFVIRQQIYLTNSKITSVQIQIHGISNIYAGLILGVYWTSDYTANGVMTEGFNYINGGVILNCANVVSQSQSGC
ncbi:Hypothetical_protein [Hexamita inflata]|uniref:Hypothetical_protein n=1 Tax=Hexamita inflata TaxID=28002 RepID=A0AA86QPA5_9EUKA|nr:Hypothetical protein HINF_LOCUS48057 [Hexamita inflata]CAI9960413.1 Hypothetical protein HINF_LOCUS48058 [Hexamita inflata]